MYKLGYRIIIRRTVFTCSLINRKQARFIYICPSCSPLMNQATSNHDYLKHMLETLNPGWLMGESLVVLDYDKIALCI